MLSFQGNNDASPYVLLYTLFVWDWRCTLIPIRTKEVTAELFKFFIVADKKDPLNASRY